MGYKRTKLGKLFYDITMKAGAFLMCHPVLAQILGATWGFIGTFIGAVEMLVALMRKNKTVGRFNGFPYVKFGDNWGGLTASFGFLIADGMGEPWTAHSMQHETGHAFQNAIFGPLFPFIVLIPSAIRYWVVKIRGYRKPYDAIWFEGSATDLGEKYHNFRLHDDAE